MCIIYSLRMSAREREKKQEAGLWAYSVIANEKKRQFLFLWVSDNGALSQ